MIEVKKPSGKATSEQLEFVLSVKRRGGVGMVVHSIDEVVEALNVGHA